MFNEWLRSARNEIECASGRLKARWCILTRKIDFNTEMVPTVIYACFVLHNFCESHGCSLDEEAVKAQMRQNQIEEDINKNIPDSIYSCTTGEGVVVRDSLASFIGQIITCDGTKEIWRTLHISNRIPFSSMLILEIAESYGYSSIFHLVILCYFILCF